MHLKSNKMRAVFESADSEDCAYGFQIDAALNCMDIDFIGYDCPEHGFQLIGCLGLFDCMACNACWNGNKLYYCQFCFSSRCCLGCVSLNQKEYCIFNRRYSQGDYKDLAAEVRRSMQKRGEWEAFFPASLSPFGYNESIAMDWFPLSKEDAGNAGWKWQTEKYCLSPASAVAAADLPDSIDEIRDDIVDRVLACSVSGRLFKITRRELVFHRRIRLSISREHPEERHSQRTARRHGREVWV